MRQLQLEYAIRINLTIIFLDSIFRAWYKNVQAIYNLDILKGKNLNIDEVFAEVNKNYNIG